MRADRLLSILLFLQTGGPSTTGRLAEEFEVSQRTILRDLFALRVAGFPVYTERGPHGGCYLHEEYRNTLTQLTNDEIAAFFLSSIHKPFEDLGLSGQLRAARLKLAAALPEARRAVSNRLAQRVVIDTHPWTKRARPTGFLAVLHQAAMEDRWVRAVFVRRFDVTTRQRIATTAWSREPAPGTSSGPERMAMCASTPCRTFTGRRWKRTASSGRATSTSTRSGKRGERKRRRLDRRSRFVCA